MAKKDLTKEANEILKLAEENGLQSNFFFATTFERYTVQLKILSNLKEILETEGMLVKKEYVKGRKNLYANPAVAEYNRTVDSANKTVSTLMKILKNYGVEEQTEEEDPLLSILGGGADD